MGSGSSHLCAPPRRATKVIRSKTSLASLICGASSSRTASETEDHAVGSMVTFAGYPHPGPVNSYPPTKEPALSPGQGTEFSHTKTEPKCLSPSTTVSDEEPLFENGLSDNVESASKKKYHAESNELVPSSLPKDRSKYIHDNTASTSFSREQSSMNPESEILSVDEANEPDDNKTAQNFTEDLSHSRLPIQQEPENLTSSEHTGIEGHDSTVTEVHDSTSDSSPGVSTSIIGSQAQEDNTFQEAIPPSLGFLVSDTAQGRTEGNGLHVDLVSISSSNLSRSSDDEVSAREARRNSRRTSFWNAFSVRSSRRRTDFPAILFAEEDGDRIRSPRGWLLDFGGDFFDNDMSDDPWHLGRRSHFTRERRWHSRSELLGRLQSGASERTRRVCPMGLHPDGFCSCDWDEETTYQTSISRIVMLAEALFVVLDEIHRQPASFALSMVSNPAPESVVDSLPLKSYVKSDTKMSGDDNEQCYICLSEYENGDRIRVLPCNHEYHMDCVDRWLKDIHGVCPLCRGDVRQGRQEGSESCDPLLNPSVAQPEPH